MSAWRRRVDPWAVGLVVLAVAVRLVYLLQQRANPFFAYPLMDSLYHVEWARALAAGEDFQPGPFFRAPLYPWLLGTALRLFGEQYLWLRALGALLGGATTALTYLVGRRAFGVAVGRVAALLVALNWVLVYFDGELLIPTLAVPLDLVALYLTLGLERARGPRPVALAGMAWGVAALARPNVLLVVPFLGAWLLWRARPRWSAGLGRAALLGLGTLLPIVPITTYNLVVGGDAVLISSQAGVNLWIGNNPASDGSTAIVPGTRPGWWDGYRDAIALAEQAEGRTLAPSEVSAHYTGRALAFWRGEPRAAAQLFWWKLRLFASRYELGNNQDVRFFAERYSALARWLLPSWWLLVPLGLVGLALARGARVSVAPLAWFVALYALSVLLFFVCSRYRVPLLPPLAVLGAHALVRAWTAARARAWTPLACGVAAWGALLALVLPVPAAVDTSDAKGLWQLGLFELEHGRAHEALPFLHQAQERNPRFWLAWRDLGTALVQTGQARRGLEAWSEALRLSPGDLQVSGPFVELALQLGELDAAERAAREAVERYPQLTPPYDALAQVALARGGPDAARAALSRGLALDPRDFLLNLRLGLVELAAQRPCAAVERSRAPRGPSARPATRRGRAPRSSGAARARPAVSAPQERRRGGARSGAAPPVASGAGSTQRPSEAMWLARSAALVPGKSSAIFATFLKSFSSFGSSKSLARCFSSSSEASTSFASSSPSSEVCSATAASYSSVQPFSAFTSASTWSAPREA
ncbi:MAG: glycosyltransferase family 39 protein [Planctomycetes bacterium]|nr:glycosyltransferase family 39 protein [Planctomycetota bacterium]